MHQMMIVMRMALFLLAALLLSPFLFIPTVEAAPPKALKVISGSLDPGETASYAWNLNRDVSEYLFHYEITGGSDSFDVVYVSIDETGDNWQYLMGRGWAYCDCALSTGAYTVTVWADVGATGRLSFNVGFYLVPQPPVDFAGFIPTNSTTRTSDFGVLFPTASEYTIVLGTTAGSYELLVDGETQGVVSGTQTLTLDLTGDFHLFGLSSSAVSPDEDVNWSVQVQGQPKLEVSIVNPQSGGCNATLNPESGQSACVAGATAVASDGANPTVTYQWTASGGQFNSTGSQWITWTPPPGVATFTLTVQASAQGYISGSDSLSIQVVPEFPSFVAPLLLVVVLGFAVLARRRSRNCVA